MDKITATYAFFRRLEERSGFIVKPGERLVYTARSRFPWLDPIFDEPPGIVAEVLRADYDPAEGPDYDTCDNHHHFYLGFFEVHEGICTTEIAAFFNVLGDEDRLARISQEAVRAVLRGTVGDQEIVAIRWQRVGNRCPVPRFAKTKIRRSDR